MSRAGSSSQRKLPQQVLFVPVLVGSILLIAAATALGTWLRERLVGRGDPWPSRVPTATPAGLRSIRDYLLGRGKAAVVAALGQPRTATIAEYTATHRPNFWHADTWYYALNPQTQTAMAIRFESGVAREIDFFDAPAGAIGSTTTH